MPDLSFQVKNPLGEDLAEARHYTLSTAEKYAFLPGVDAGDVLSWTPPVIGQTNEDGSARIQDLEANVKYKLWIKDMGEFIFTMPETNSTLKRAVQGPEFVPETPLEPAQGPGLHFYLASAASIAGSLLNLTVPFDGPPNEGNVIRFIAPFPIPRNTTSSMSLTLNHNHERELYNIEGNDVVPSEVTPTALYEIQLVQGEWRFTYPLARRPQDYYIYAGWSTDTDITAAEMTSRSRTNMVAQPNVQVNGYLAFGVPVDTGDINSIQFAGREQRNAFTEIPGTLTLVNIGPGTRDFKLVRSFRQFSFALAGETWEIGQEYP